MPTRRAMQIWQDITQFAHSASMSMSSLEASLPSLSRAVTRARTSKSLRELARRLALKPVQLSDKSAWYELQSASIAMLQAQTQVKSSRAIARYVAAAGIYSYLSRISIKPAKVCPYCWRHAIPGRKYCHEDRRVGSYAQHRQAERRKASMARDRDKRWILSLHMDLVHLVRKLETKQTREITPDPHYWRGTLEDCIRKVSSPAICAAVAEAMKKTESWKSAVESLRNSLGDKHCRTYDVRVWRKKLKLADIWEIESRDLRRSDLPQKIHAEITQDQTLTRMEIADRLGVNKATITKRLTEDKKNGGDTWKLFKNKGWSGRAKIKKAKA